MKNLYESHAISLVNMNIDLISVYLHFHGNIVLSIRMCGTWNSSGTVPLKIHVSTVRPQSQLMMHIIVIVSQFDTFLIMVIFLQVTTIANYSS